MASRRMDPDLLRAAEEERLDLAFARDLRAITTPYLVTGIFGGALVVERIVYAYPRNCPVCDHSFGRGINLEENCPDCTATIRTSALPRTDNNTKEDRG